MPPPIGDSTFLSGAASTLPTVATTARTGCGDREDLTVRQKHEIAETLSIPNQYELSVGEIVKVDR